MDEKNIGGSGKRTRRVVERRQFLQILVPLSIAGTIVSFLSLLTSLLPAKGVGQQQGEVDNIFRYGAEKGTWYSDRAGAEVRAEDLDEIGKGASVLWRGSIPGVIIRVDENKLRGAAATGGLIAFATTCTHLCCIATWRLDRPSQDVIFCRCHDGVFDPYDVVKDVMANGSEYLGAKVIGGPPPRAAPIIPIEIKDGKVAGVPKNLEIYGYCG
jgi:Rieske Fe-S protein